jgi:hypothetical protein
VIPAGRTHRSHLSLQPRNQLTGTVGGGLLAADRPQLDLPIIERLLSRPLADAVPAASPSHPWLCAAVVFLL